MNLIKVPFASFDLAKNSGVKKAPDAILQNLKNFPFPENHLLSNFQIKEIPFPPQISLNTPNLQESFQNITRQAKTFFQNSEQNLFLGGDHSITFPLFQAFAQTHQNPGLLLFDAHPDARSDLPFPDLLPALLQNHLLKKENLLLVGLRNWTKEEYFFLKQNNLQFFPMQEIALESLYETSEAIMSIAKNFGSLYLSIDIDVLDPAFAPGTSCPEPGGLTTRELLFFLHRLKKLKNFRAADLVEINPEIDKNTALVGAKIIAELY